MTPPSPQPARARHMVPAGLLCLCLPLAPAMAHAQPASSAQPTPSEQQASSAPFLGFDRNTFPGDAALAALHQHFSFVGYWLNNPPGASGNTWAGRRDQLAHAGFGFLVLWNGRLDAQIMAQSKAHGTHAAVTPQTLGHTDAEAAVRAAHAERFPAGTILFLDQEEGGRLLPEQAAYLLAWTEAVATSGFRAGVYSSGQPVDDGPGPTGQRQTITTAQDISERVRAGGLHPVALWVAQDACGPSTGCTLTPPPLRESGTPGALVWQYAQSPRRPAITRSCARTYNAAGNCTVPELPSLFLDLNLSSSADPSHGR